MAVIAIHGNSEQWCENNLLFDLVPKTSSFCFLSPKPQAFISLCSAQKGAFHFQQWQDGSRKGQIQKDVPAGGALPVLLLQHSQWTRANIWTTFNYI